MEPQCASWDLNWSKPGVIAHDAERRQKVAFAPIGQESVPLSEPVKVQPR
jgi:hypothetical protein